MDETLIEFVNLSDKRIEIKRPNFVQINIFNSHTKAWTVVL